MERIFLRGIKTRYGNILGSPDFFKEALKKYDRRKGNDPFLAPQIHHLIFRKWWIWCSMFSVQSSMFV